MKISLTQFVAGATDRVRGIDHPAVLNAARLEAWIRDSLRVVDDGVGREQLATWLREAGRNAAAELQTSPRALFALIEALPDLVEPRQRVTLPPSSELVSLATIAEAAPPTERVLALNGLWNAMRRSPGPMVDDFDVMLSLDAEGYVQASTPRGSAASARVHRGRFAAWLTDTPEGGDFARRHPTIAAAYSARRAA